jgi:hypothetical protein
MITKDDVWNFLVGLVVLMLLALFVYLLFTVKWLAITIIIICMSLLACAIVVGGSLLVGAHVRRVLKEMKKDEKL